MNKWVVLYHHRHGEDLFFVESEEMPSEEDMERTFPETLWELELDSEWIECFNVTNTEFVKVAA